MDNETFLDEYIIHHYGKSRLFKVHNTISKTQRVNRMGYTWTKKYLNRLGYETVFENGKQILKLKQKVSK